MKNTLLNLLNAISPSRVILNNCIELIQREQVGLVKYGVSLTDAKLTHEQVLQHLLEEQLDAANYTRKALMTASQAHVNYAELRKEVESAIHNMGYLRYNGSASPDEKVVTEVASNAYDKGTDDAAELLQEALFRFDSEKLRRDLRK